MLALAHSPETEDRGTTRHGARTLFHQLCLAFAVLGASVAQMVDGFCRRSAYRGTSSRRLGAHAGAPSAYVV